MTSAEYAKLAQQGQDAVNAAVRSWADSMQRMATQSPLSNLPATPELPDYSAVVDQAFDFAATLLAAQRELTKNLLDAVSKESGRASTAAPSSPTAGASS